MKPLITTKGPSDWRALLGDPEKHWRAGFSAMATAQSWDAGFPPEVAALLGPDAELQIAIAEHKVPMPGGGSPSQCDVFALVHGGGLDQAVAVEAKVEEPFGPSVSDWLDAGGVNRRLRLKGICELLGLQGKVERTLSYQLFHRTAAAVIEARRFRRPVAAMIVQSFSEENRWYESFASFVDLFGVQAGVDSSGDTRLRDGMILRLGWARGDKKYLKDRMTEWTG